MKNSGQLAEFWTPKSLKVVGAPRFELGTPCTPCEKSVARIVLIYKAFHSLGTSRIIRQCAPISPCFGSARTFDSGRYPAAHAAVKTHDSLDPAGSSRNRGWLVKVRAATSLPEALARDSRCPQAALSAGDIREPLTPAPKGECTVSRAGRRLATDKRHSRVKQESPQTA